MIINDQLLDNVTVKAEESPRLRMNYNLHDSLDAKAQRLINVLLPGTPLPIHRHKHTAETYIILRGKMFVVFYNDLGAQTERILLDPTNGNYGVQIPKGQWHGIEVIEPSAIFEVKDGPYTPLEPEDMLD
ncbi:WbuC family cupin fold metalloprotein [uncultured Duncaniella sp.]|jgi:cupin fold WbuC family metalloprotein|uniref:WbuC family cupin fold metalloprotein n=1 Tax=uncultured Duncaniella sp. TaxID=2768039 RepID=UPI0026F40027|nr:WbuC family cupin fold metalloprotein [uncultured Duncaniella sp.]